jgi:quinol monooxygenase YgiN
MEGIAVFAKLVARPGQGAELLEALGPLIRSAMEDEPGTEVYAVHLDPDDGDVVWFYEIFADQAAVEAHTRNEERLHEVGAQVQELLEGPVEVSWGRLHLLKGVSLRTPT